MRLLPSDPDIETIVSRIEKNELDLQPNFQRGEVWSMGKKQRLIDSILRDWHVPPIHVVEATESGKQEVLDGQQRLAAIRDFVRGEIAVDGKIQPESEEIKALDGVKFRTLPEEWRRKFYRFTIRVFRLIDFTPAEPSELFYRLNQPTTLTGAEQRNAFFGKARDQVREWVIALDSNGIDNKVLGFSNARMAYNDILARVAFTVEKRTLAERITASALADHYRSSGGYAERVDQAIRAAVVVFGAGRQHFAGMVPFNKATLYSWLLFIVRANQYVGESDRKTFGEVVGLFVSYFTHSQLMASIGAIDGESDPVHPRDARLFQFYEVRASARVADVSSVIIRDLVIWLSFCNYLSLQSTVASCKRFRELLQAPILAVEKIYGLASGSSPFDESALVQSANTAKWGILV